MVYGSLARRHFHFSIPLRSTRIRMLAHASLHSLSLSLAQTVSRLIMGILCKQSQRDDKKKRN